MHIYKLTPSSDHPHIEHLTNRDQLYELSGKFLYFPHYNSLFVVDDPDIYHKDIYELAKQATINSEHLINDHHPHGYGKLTHGQVESWESHFFGSTPEDVRETISQGFESFHRD